MHVAWGLVRLGLLLLAVAALACVAPGAASAQQSQPQCSDLVDNDADGAVDGADAGCGDGSDPDESDSVYAGIRVITVALPVVTLQGTVDARGTVNLSRVLIRALRGSIVEVSCKGKRCPFKHLRRIMITSSLRIGALERRALRAPMTLSMRIARPGQLGKYVRYKIRRKQAPVRKDACLDQATQKVGPCFVG